MDCAFTCTVHSIIHKHGFLLFCLFRLFHQLLWNLYNTFANILQYFFKQWCENMWYYYRPLTRYVKLRVGHAPGILGTFSRHWRQRPPLVIDPRMHHGSCVMQMPPWMHVGIGNLWWRGKRSWHSRPMRNPQFYVSGKRPIDSLVTQPTL